MRSSPHPGAESPDSDSIRRQEVLAELGQRASEAADTDALVADAVTTVTETLEADYGLILELSPDGDRGVLRWGTGWQVGVVGSATVPTTAESHVGRVLRSESALVVDDLRTDDRFSDSDSESELLARHGVLSGICVGLGPPEDPWGILGIYADEPDTVSDRDVAFVQHVASVLGAAIRNGDLGDVEGQDRGENQTQVEGQDRAENQTLEEDRTQNERHDFAEMHDRITDGFYSLDEDWEFTHLNEHAAELIDYTGEGLVGEHIWETFEWGADSKLRTEYERAMETQESTTFELYYPEPLETWYEVNAYPSDTGLSVYFRDVDDRKQIENELRETNRTLQRLYEITADRERPFEEKVARLLELGQERLGLTVGFVANIDEKRDRFEVVHAIGDDDRVQPGRTTPLSDTYCRRTVESDGLLVLANAPAEGWQDDHAYGRWDFDAYVGGKVHVDDDLYGTICFADESARQRPFTSSEQRFVELATQWLGYELERQYHHEKLAASNERLEQFAYVASHDLQEPLRMVTSYLQLLEDRHEDALDEDATEFLDFAVDGAERMREMIDGLLEYSRIETRGDPFEPTDLDAVLEDVRADLRVRLEESDTVLTVGELPCVGGDASQLRQLFQNLIDNAITYSGDDSPTIEISAERHGDEWRLSVRDDGIGIDPGDQERIFEVFHRLHSHEEHPGTGIGLALCQRIVERHGGEVRVDSEPGVGSTFTVTLPALE